MTAQLIRGDEIAKQQRAMLKQRIQAKHQEGQPPPGLAVVMVGDNPASRIYVKNKRQACQEMGYYTQDFDLPIETSEAILLKLITQLNHDPRIHGILIQLPLPKQIDPVKVIEQIDPIKDVDGFHPYNLGRLAIRRPELRPCTPYGVIRLLQAIAYDPRGKLATVVGASNIVGRPMVLELLLAGATVTCCHKFTQDLAPSVKQADLLISAVGKPHLIKAEWIKPGAVVIDIGITRLADGTLTGDIEFEKAKKIASWITPVPGGVGPMTIATLLENTWHAYCCQELRS